MRLAITLIVEYRNPTNAPQQKSTPDSKRHLTTEEGRNMGLNAKAFYRRGRRGRRGREE